MARTDEYRDVHTYRGQHWEDLTRKQGTVLTEMAARASDGTPYLTAFSDYGEPTTLTYSELIDLSARLSTWLHVRYGVTIGSIVGLLPCNDLFSVVALFAIMRAGATVLVLNPLDPAPRIRTQLQHQGATVTLFSPKVPSDATKDAVAIPGFDTLTRMPRAAVSDVEPMMTAMYFPTSGSTATSKVVAQSHASLIANARGVCAHHGLKPGDRLLGCLPLHHVNGVHFTLLATFVAGAHAFLVHSFDPFRYPELLRSTRPRIASVTPSILEVLLSTWRRPSLPSDFSYFVSAAAPLSKRTAQIVHRELNTRVLQGYGLTETTNFSTTVPADISAESYRRLVLDAEIPSVGVAIGGNELTILRPDGTPAGPGDSGEICMRGHNVMTRYAKNRAATAEAFRDGWFHSGDLGYSVRDPSSANNMFFIVGRKKNIAKVGGESVSLEEVERALITFPEILDAACAAVPFPVIGDAVIAAVVLYHKSDINMKKRLAEVLSPHAVPRKIVIVEQIPRTSTGKILRADLTEWLVAQYGKTEPFSS